LTLRHATLKDIDAMREYHQEQEYAQARAQMRAEHEAKSKELGLGSH
jgi:hypothetical protein